MSENELSVVLDYIRHLGRGADPIQETDRSLLRRYSEAGDQTAFAALIRRHGSLVHGVCTRLLRHPQDAEDAFQATFLVLARKAGAIRWQDSISSWLYEVAHRVAAEARGKQARLRSREKQMDEVPDRAAASAPELSEQLPPLDEELRRLPEKYRAPLVLCYLEGWTRDEAAALLGCSEGSVKGRLERGREVLRRRLARRGLTLAGALVPSLLSVDASQAASLESLVRQTLELIAHVRADGPTGPAVELANAVLAAMMGSKLKAVGVLVCALLVSGAGVTALALRGTDGNNNPPAVAPVTPALASRPEPRLPPSVPAQQIVNWEAQELMRQHQGAVRAVVFVPGDTLYAAATSDDGSVKVWGPRGTAFRGWLTDAPPVAVAASPDGKLVVAGTDKGELFGWDVAKTDERFARLTHMQGCSALAFAPQGRWLASANENGTISIHNGENGHRIRRCFGHEGRVRAIAYSPDGKRLASAGTDGTVRLWDPMSGKAVSLLGRHEAVATAVAYLPDGKRVASYGQDGVVRLWDAEAGKLLRTIDAGPGDSLCCSPDGRLLATAGYEHDVSLWDVETGERLFVLRGHTDRVCAVGFSPDGRQLVTGSQDRTVRIWDVDKLRPN